MLTETQISLIKTSARRMADSDVLATNLFYTKLFEVAPSVRPLFPVDMFRQSEKLWESIVTVVNALHQLEDLREPLMLMGKRHVEYGAAPAHYEAVRAILIETIADFHTDDWSKEHAEAWDIALTYVCDTMQAGAHETAA